MTTGERIRQLRIEHDMTQEELGAKVGVQKAAIYKYETGLIVNLKRSTIEKLAIALSTTPTYLMGMEDAEAVQPVLAEFTPQQTALLTAFNKLNDEGQDKVITYAEDLNRTGYYKKTARLAWLQKKHKNKAARLAALRRFIMGISSDMGVIALVLAGVFAYVAFLLWTPKKF